MLVKTSYDERALLEKLAAGDEAAFNQLYRHYQVPVWQFVHKFVKSPELTDDITQEIFIRIWEKRSMLPQLQSFTAFIVTVARNYTFDVLKRLAGEEAARSEVFRHYPVQRNAVEEELLSHEYQQHLRQALQSLPTQTRAVFSLCREQYKSYEEVAALLGISRNAVKKHIVRSMKTFRHLLTTDLDISLPFLLFFILH